MLPTPILSNLMSALELFNINTEDEGVKLSTLSKILPNLNKIHSGRLVPLSLFVGGRLHTGSSQEKPKEASYSPIL